MQTMKMSLLTIVRFFPPSPKQKVILLNGGDGSYDLMCELLQSTKHSIACDHSIDQWHIASMFPNLSDPTYVCV